MMTGYIVHARTVMTGKVRVQHTGKNCDEREGKGTAYRQEL